MEDKKAVWILGTGMLSKKCWKSRYLSMEASVNIVKDFGNTNKNKNFCIFWIEHDISRYGNDESLEHSCEIYLHPLYKNGSDYFENDIALVRVDVPWNLSDPGVAPIDIPESSYEATGDAVVSGWGQVSENQTKPTFPNILKKATVPIISDAECRKVYGAKVTDSMLCGR